MFNVTDADVELRLNQTQTFINFAVEINFKRCKNRNNKIYLINLIKLVWFC